MLKEVFARVSELFEKAKFYEANVPIQNGLYLVFEGVSFESFQTNYEFKLLVAGNSLNKDSKSALTLCDECLKIIEENQANCFENYPSKLRAKGIERTSVNESLFCYEISFVLELRLLKGV